MSSPPCGSNLAGRLPGSTETITVGDASDSYGTAHTHDSRDKGLRHSSICKTAEVLHLHEAVDTEYVHDPEQLFHTTKISNFIIFVNCNNVVQNVNATKLQV